MKAGACALSETAWYGMVAKILLARIKICKHSQAAGPGHWDKSSSKNYNITLFLGQGFKLEVHRIVIFTIRPDAGFAGYLKKIIMLFNLKF